MIVTAPINYYNLVVLETTFAAKLTLTSDCVEVSLPRGTDAFCGKLPYQGSCHPDRKKPLQTQLSPDIFTIRSSRLSPQSPNNKTPFSSIPSPVCTLPQPAFCTIPQLPVCAIQQAQICAIQRSEVFSPKENRDPWLENTEKMLKLSEWHYGNLDWQGARTILRDASPGAFLIRKSAEKGIHYSLSVQTERGPTSVRLPYKDGFFRLDSDKTLAGYMPRFPCVIRLVQHYSNSSSSHGTVWIDRDGCPHSRVLLKTPLRRKPPSLLHAARLAIHKALDSNPLIPKIPNAQKYRLLPLPKSLLDYLGEYPYTI